MGFGFGTVLASAIAALACAGSAVPLDESRQATGVKVGEVTSSTAVVWMRVTQRAERRADGVVRKGRPDRTKTETLDPLTLEGSVPGAAGRVRVRYGTGEDLANAADTGWVDVDPNSDFTDQLPLTGLKPATVYHFVAETSSADGQEIHQPLRGRFETAPLENAYRDVAFTVITGQAYRSLDADGGFLIYDAMLRLGPKFFVATGDTVYYDNDDPLVTNVDIARYHWHRIYSLPKLIAFHLSVPAYWEKDDHDVYVDDSWPGMTRPYMGSFSFEQGRRVYAEQVPQSGKPYRTFRWGQGLQIWLTEGRDFRSSNTMPDGPHKSIWGAEQKRWLKDTLLASDADWRILISPTPIVGPDRPQKADNHANKAFQHEGDEFRQWVTENLGDNFFVVCGDRHWQYHSKHPATGIEEFSSGPVSDPHAGGSPGENSEYHRFHRVAGGFLSVSAKRAGDDSVLTFKFHDVNGKVVYEYSRSRPVT